MSDLTLKTTGKGSTRKATLELAIPKDSERVSGSGKTIILGHGVSAYDVVIDGKPVKAEVNIYRKNPDYVKE